MSTDDVTQPWFPTAETTTWPPSPPTASRNPARRPPRRFGAGLGCLGVALGFGAGVIVTALLALALFAAPPAPSASGSAGPALKVTLTDALLTKQLADAQRAATNGVLAQPRVHVQADGKIVISGVLQGAGSFSGATAMVVARPYVSQGRLAVTLTNATIGGFPVPLAAVSAVRDQMNQQLARASRFNVGAGESLVVSRVTFSDGALTLVYATA